MIELKKEMEGGKKPLKRHNLLYYRIDDKEKEETMNCRQYVTWSLLSQRVVYAQSADCQISFLTNYKRRTLDNRCREKEKKEREKKKKRG
jgi:hypothetical protein